VNEIRIGDCREIMKALIAEGVKVQTCITSPPYFGLRDYGTAKWEGGDPSCAHQGDKRWYTESTAATSSSGAFSEPGEENAERLKKGRWREAGTCRCGAVHVDSQLGIEETPAEYVASMVEVFRLVRELLADDGTLWLNLGDSYAGSGRGRNSDGTHSAAGTDCMQATNRGSVLPAGLHRSHVEEGALGRAWTKAPEGFKQKDLIGIPWRVAFALQAEGWYLRSDIIWAKPNPMPESVTDRPTKSHEYIFLLSKSADYFYDIDAIREPHLEESIKRAATPWNGNGVRNHPSGRGQLVSGGRAEGAPMNTCHPNGRNKRSVWTVCTQPYDGAHFATFPPDLILPCVLAGSRPGDVVFDPFMGSGTTALVAKKNGRRYLGCELNPDYRALQLERLAQEVLFGPEVPA
jgi:DNA modification methylase